jgi:hypothetical protein
MTIYVATAAYALWYNKGTGLNFKLDVGLYRLDQQVACQRYRQTTIVAKTTFSDMVNNVLARRESFAFAA